MQVLDAVPITAVPLTAASHGATALPACMSCGTARVGTYCHGCGQSVEQEGRLTMRGYVGALFHFVTHFDHGLPHTLGALFRSPGDLARRYVAGERQHFTHPLTLLLLSAVFVVLTFPLYEAPFRELIAENMRASSAELTPESRAITERVMGTPDVMADKTLAFVKANMKVVAFLNAFPLAFALAFLLRRRYTVAEWLVATMYLVAGVNIVTGLTNPLFIVVLPAIGLPVSANAMSLVNLAIFAAATGWMATRFYRPGARSAAFGVLAYALSTGFIMMLVGVAGVVIGIVMGATSAA